MWSGFARRFRVPIAVGVVGVLVVGLAVLGRVFWPSAPVPAPRAADTPESAALLEAGRSGREVEVAGSTTATSRVLAQPGGFLRAEISPIPVRAETASGWQALDARLARQSDGRWAPAVSTREVSISGGGSGPVLWIGPVERRLELVWPAELPEPVIDGDAAVFAEVLPGVDLVVRALGDGVAHYLVVKNRTASENPQLAEVRLGWRGAGLELRQGPDGSIEAVAGDGEVIFGAPSATMWTTGNEAAGQAVLADGAAGSARAARGADAGREAPVSVAVTDQNLVLSPSLDLLADPATVFPVVIDPMFVEQRKSWAMVWSDGQYFRNPSGATNARVGFDGWSGGNKISRTYYEMWTGGVWNGRQVLNAQFRHFQTHSPNTGCNAGSYGPNVQLGFTGAIGSDITWSKQPAWLETIAQDGLAVGSSVTCGTKRMQAWDITSFLQTHPGYAAITFGLRSANESDANGWRQYAHDSFDAGGFGAPLLVVDYNSVPATPGAPWVTAQTYAGVGYINQSSPPLRSLVSDPDGDRVRAVHMIQQVGGSYPIIEIPGPVVSSGDTSISTPGFGLCDCTFDVWAKAQDMALDGVTVKSTSADSPKTRFTVDTVRPAAPTVTAPSGSVPVGQAVSIGLSTAAADGVKYRWSVASNTLSNEVVVALGAGATVSYTPTVAGWHQIHAVVEDRAGNVSDTTTTVGFMVGSTTANHYYPLNSSGADLGSSPAALTVTGANLTALGHGYYVIPGTTSSGVNACTDKAFQSGSATAQTAGAAVTTTASFSLAGWTKPTGSLGTVDYRAAVSVPRSSGGDAAALGVRRNGSGTWVYAFGVAPGTGGLTWVLSDVPATADQWAHVAGVYDSAGGRITVYVNGSAAGTATVSGTPSAGSALVVGTGAGSTGWLGVIDEVRTWAGPAPASEVVVAADWMPDYNPCP